MASRINELHYNFPKLAEESGFSFNVHRPRIRIDWNKIRLIDVDSIIRDRKFHVVEQHMNCILDCGLENEFDVRILEEGFVKMFRLAQLAVEYQQFCRHYLDRSVHVLREEITALAQELSVTKREVFEKEEEIKKLKKRKHFIRTVPLGNDNIANLILRTLHNKGEIIPSTSTTDILHYNKCNYCEKVFLNQLYLKSHISRRHDIMEIPEKDDTSTKRPLNDDNELVNKEISELKSKLKNMEDIITNMSNKCSNFDEQDKERNDINTIKPKEAKDVGVSMNIEEHVTNDIDKWKIQEQEKYNKELALLRTQIMEAVNSYKEQTNIKETNENNKEEINHIIVEQLHSTIKEQGAEIMALKQQISNAKLNTDSLEWRKQYESQIMLWAKRAEEQSQQYHELLNKLDEVSKEAQSSREQAEIEKKTTLRLQSLLKQTIKNHRNPVLLEITKNDEIPKKNNKLKTVGSNKPTVKQDTLDSLQRAAQQLLKEELTTSSDNTSQSEINLNTSKNDKKNCIPNNFTAFKPNKLRIEDIKQKHYDTNLYNVDINTTRLTKKTKSKPKKSIKEKLNQKSSNNENKTKDQVLATSPVKIVRAKITEEVNNQLASLGIDPFKSKIPQSVFKKEKLRLQQRQELKAKKNPAHETARHKILTHLDSTSADIRTAASHSGSSSPLRRTKQFSLTSVFSNVKNKAMSLVKSNDLSKGVVNQAAKKTSLSIEPSINNNYDGERPKLHNKQDKIKTHINTNSFKKNTSLSDSDLDATSLNSDIEETRAKGSLFQQSSKSVDLLIKSPVRRPMSAKENYTSVTKTENFARTNVTQESEIKSDYSVLHKELKLNADYSEDESSSNRESSAHNNNIETQSSKMTKGVLKNASSISSLNKKKVIFDMDAIQMKSLSASPSQSITEKSDSHEKSKLDILNIDEEWDISSIDNEPKQIQTEVQLNTRTSPKIAELTKTIELQLSRRSDVPKKVITHGVDTLKGGNLQRVASMGGSNTSLGSSILDDSDNADSRQSNNSSKSKNEKDSNLDFNFNDVLKNYSF